MKKQIIIVLTILSIFLVVGCTNVKDKEKVDKIQKTNKIESKKDTYIKYVKKLKKVTTSDQELPFKVDVVYEKMAEEIRFQVVIDEPTGEIKNIRALAIHDKQTDDVFPSVGIFDDKVSLVPNKKPSGVILVGYIPYEGDMDDFEAEIKVLIEYEYEGNVKTSYYLTKK